MLSTFRSMQASVGRHTYIILAALNAAAQACFCLQRGSTRSCCPSSFCKITNPRPPSFPFPPPSHTPLPCFYIPFVIPHSLSWHIHSPIFPPICPSWNPPTNLSSRPYAPPGTPSCIPSHLHQPRPPLPCIPCPVPSPPPPHHHSSCHHIS